ncbi:MAG: hypothetical protein VR69_06480 [Peptococcaceae bacterium BRH_c4b]|nr:MAG: hypothetical protein VR69_06480 [Peptococcaceae bacterium BRH_c4b]
MLNPEKIALISLSTQLTRAVQKIRDTTCTNFEIIEAFLDEVVTVAQELEQNKFEIILALPYTSSIVKNYVQIPVVPIYTDGLDLMKAVYKAKKLGPKIAYVAFNQEKIRNDFENLLSISGIDIYPYYYKNQFEMRDSIRQVYEDGIDVVIVTGTCMKHMAEKMGMKTIKIEPGNDTLLEYLNKAYDIIALNRREKERTRRLQTIIDMISDGIINIDQHGKINVVNTAAAQVLNLPREQIIGTSRDTIGSLINENGRSIIKTIGSSTLIVNKAKILNEAGQIEEIIALKDVTEIQRLERLVQREMKQKGLVAKYTFNDIIGQSRAINRAIEKARLYASSDSNILITGETGTGKELFAQSIHNTSNRSNGPFVALNCATLPESLLESELFGYEPGTFTGARKGGKSGLFELSHNGTIFLDEIGEIPISLQAKLLRVIQDKEVRRLGGEKVIPMNVRIVAATNLDLEDAVNRGNFRADMYYRLNVLSIKVPPLRERYDDIPLLVNFFMDKFSRNHTNQQERVNFTDDMLQSLLSYRWPGNVRELENFIEKFMYLYKKCSISGVNLIKSLLYDSTSQSSYTCVNPGENPGEDMVSIRIGPLKEMEKELIHNVALKMNIHKNKLAEILGISRTTLWKKLNS